MQHTIPLEQLAENIGPQIEGMAKAIETCVHCGFCLPSCPTYQVLGEEMDSPRGRIVLMKSVLEGEIEISEAAPYIDRCLACLACVTACPSGVQYGELLTPFRAHSRQQVKYGILERYRRNLLNSTLPDPARFRKAMLLGQVIHPVRGLMPGVIKDLLAYLPPVRSREAALPELTPAIGKRRARVAFLTGCVQQILAPEINQATIRVLAANGIEVVLPPGQVCCGGILMHTGELEEARRLARINLEAFPLEVDAVLTNAAGCGSGMHDYPQLFKGLEEEQRAKALAEKTFDVIQFLDQLGLVSTLRLPQPMRVAYHDACHLAHAQKITEAPRRALAEVENLTLVELADGGFCCGSAGTYNLEQAEIAGELGRRKAAAVQASGAEAVVMGNIGCMMQIRAHLASAGKLLPVFHTIELLDMASTRM